MTQSFMPRRRNDIETHLMPDGSCLLYDPEQAEGHVLNVIGSFIWEYCDGTLTPDQIAAELTDALPQIPDAHADALRIIAELEIAGLLAASSATPAATPAAMPEER